MDYPPSLLGYRELGTRVVDLNPLTIIQNARTSSGGVISNIICQEITVEAIEKLKSGKVSIWQAGRHDNPVRICLAALVITKKLWILLFQCLY